jgi:hypothetical protein
MKATLKSPIVILPFGILMSSRHPKTTKELYLLTPGCLGSYDNKREGKIAPAEATEEVIY